MGRRLATLGLVALAFACGKSGNKLERAHDARITFVGGEAALMVGKQSVAIPDGEVTSEGVVIWRDDPSERLAFEVRGQEFRLVYRVGQSWFLGPRRSGPVSFKDAPPRDDVLPVLYELSAGTDLAQQLLATRGQPALSQLMADTATSCDARWWKHRPLLDASEVPALHAKLAVRFDRRDPVAACALRELDLAAPERAAALPDQTKRAMNAKHDRTAAIMLRYLLQRDPSAAAAMACTELAGTPIPKEMDDDTELFLETLVLALAKTETCGSSYVWLAQLAGLAEEMRCNPDGTLVDGRQLETTKWDEPLCSPQQMADMLAAEARQPPMNAFTAMRRSPRRFAFALLATRKRLPDELVTAHARRRYAIQQPAGPECTSIGTSQTPCHCAEGTLRQGAFRTDATRAIEYAGCALEVDDATKTIKNVRTPWPPVRSVVTP